MTQIRKERIKTGIIFTHELYINVGTICSVPILSQCNFGTLLCIQRKLSNRDIRYKIKISWTQNHSFHKSEIYVRSFDRFSYRGLYALYAMCLITQLQRITSSVSVLFFHSSTFSNIQR